MCIATADQKDQKNRTKKRRINYQAMQVKILSVFLFRLIINKPRSCELTKRNCYGISSEAIQWTF